MSMEPNGKQPFRMGISVIGFQPTNLSKHLLTGTRGVVIVVSYFNVYSVDINVL